MHERRFDPSRAHMLDDPQRKHWLPPDVVIAAINLREGETVVDIGAGTGYFALPAAAALGRSGLVFAVDVAAEMLAHLHSRLRETRCENVRSVEGEASATGLPPGCADVVFMANVWHEFDDHRAVLREARRLLRQGGRVAILDWRRDVEPDHGPPPDHRIALDEAKASLESAGLKVTSAQTVGRYSWLAIGQSSSGDGG